MNVGDISVLIADDVNSTRFQIRDLLKESGFKKLSLASSGEEAKACMQADGVNLVLCDWYMSPTDGLELLKWVRANPELKSVPFIMVTGESTKERVIEAIQAGVDDYLVKPLTMVQVQSKVFNVLMKKKVL